MRKDSDIDWLLGEDPFDWIEEELRGKETTQRKRVLLREAEKKYLQERDHLKMRENTIIIPTIWLEKDLKNMKPGRLKHQCNDPGRYDH
jgi:hypothetical protein